MSQSKSVKLTREAITALPSPEAGRAVYHVAKIPGLQVRVTAAGVKTFCVVRKVAGRVLRVTLGRHPDMTPEQAKKAALSALSSLASGINPTDTKRSNKAKAVTLAEVLSDYLTARKTLKPRTVKDIHAAFREVCPEWLDKPLVKITAGKIEKQHREHAARSKARANVAMRYLRALFNFAMAKYKDSDGEPIIKHNPVKILSEVRAWHRVDRRKTLIKPHELGGWVNTVLDLPAEGHRDYFMVLLLTGLRRNEAMNLQWSDVDLTGRTLTIRDPKNHNDHTLPLSDYLLDLFTRRKAAALSEFVFTDEAGRRVSNLRYAQDRIEKASGVRFTPHDLRRTFATIAESIDIPAYALKRLLNHADGADVTAGYLVVTPERLRDPMQRITDYVLKAAGLKASADVISISRANLHGAIR
jgi:integrase